MTHETTATEATRILANLEDSILLAKKQMASHLQILALTATVNDCAELLSRLIKDEDCLFDGYGWCKAHGKNMFDGKCVNALAKKLLARIKEKPE